MTIQATISSIKYRYLISNYQSRNSDALQVIRPRHELTKIASALVLLRIGTTYQEVSKELTHAYFQKTLESTAKDINYKDEPMEGQL